MLLITPPPSLQDLPVLVHCVRTWLAVIAQSRACGVAADQFEGSIVHCLPHRKQRTHQDKLWRGGCSSPVDTPCNMKLGTLLAALPPKSQGNWLRIVYITQRNYFSPRGSLGFRILLAIWYCVFSSWILELKLGQLETNRKSVLANLQQETAAVIWCTKLGSIMSWWHQIHVVSNIVYQVYI